MTSLLGTIMSGELSSFGRAPAASFVGPEASHLAVVANGKAILMTLGSFPMVVAQADIGGIHEASMFFDGMLRGEAMPAIPAPLPSLKDHEFGFDDVKKLVDKSDAPQARKSVFLEAYELANKMQASKSPLPRMKEKNNTHFRDVSLAEVAEREREKCIRNAEANAERAMAEDMALAGNGMAVEAYLSAKGVKPEDMSKAKRAFITEAHKKKEKVDGEEYQKAKTRETLGEPGMGVDDPTSTTKDIWKIGNESFSLSPTDDVSTKAPGSASKSDNPGPENPSKEHHPAPGVKVTFPLPLGG